MSWHWRDSCAINLGIIISAIQNTGDKRSAICSAKKANLIIWVKFRKNVHNPIQQLKKLFSLRSVLFLAIFSSLFVWFDVWPPKIFYISLYCGFDEAQCRHWDIRHDSWWKYCVRFLGRIKISEVSLFCFNSRKSHSLYNTQMWKYKKSISGKIGKNIISLNSFSVHIGTYCVSWQTWKFVCTFLRKITPTTILSELQSPKSNFNNLKENEKLYYV